MFNIQDGQYPVADWVNANGFYVGCHQDLTQKDLDHIVTVIDSYLSSATGIQFKKENHHEQSQHKNNIFHCTYDAGYGM